MPDADILNADLRHDRYIQKIYTDLIGAAGIFGAVLVIGSAIVSEISLKKNNA